MAGGTRVRAAECNKRFGSADLCEVLAYLYLGGCGIDDGLNLGDRIGRESTLSSMLANQLFVGRVVDAVDFVAGDVAMDPLNFGSEFAQDSAGRLGDGLQLIGRHLSSAGNFALD